MLEELMNELWKLPYYHARNRIISILVEIEMIYFMLIIIIIIIC
jgi:hypothetical protein